MKDILPSGMLRLTKYPLLFENLLKYTVNPEDSFSPEYIKVQRALERTKEILNFVNVAVREAEDNHKLLGIQKRIDRSAFDKSDGCQEFRVITHYLSLSYFLLLCIFIHLSYFYLLKCCIDFCMISFYLFSIIRTWSLQTIN